MPAERLRARSRDRDAAEPGYNAGTTYNIRYLMKRLSSAV